jgi:hypothetical protein
MFREILCFCAFVAKKEFSSELQDANNESKKKSSHQSSKALNSTKGLREILWFRALMAKKLE